MGGCALGIPSSDDVAYEADMYLGCKPKVDNVQLVWQTQYVDGIGQS